MEGMKPVPFQSLPSYLPPSYRRAEAFRFIVDELARVASCKPRSQKRDLGHPVSGNANDTR